MNTFITLICLLLLSVIIIVVGIFLYNILIGRHSVCGCYRQSDGGKRGFCGQCLKGTLFGCPNGCKENCKKRRYKGKAQPQCGV